MLCLWMSAWVLQGYRAATPGLPFTEDFSDTNLKDDSQTNANWSTEEQALLLAWRERQYGPFSATGAGSDITSDVSDTNAVALGDVDGDGDLDLVKGNGVSPGQPNRLYLNNGTSDPWNGVTGSDITGDAHSTRAVALGDVDGDGDLDLVAGNVGQPNRLYLNNGTSDPWSGVAGSDITADAYDTHAVALVDVDGDGDLDLVAGNVGQPNRLYLNNGTSDPWSGVAGSDITADAYDTYAVALGDADGDGDLDLMTGNLGQPNRLYLNNGTSDPWSGVAGSDITADSDDTHCVALGDLDGDGDLDLVAGNDGANRLYLNNGTSDPWSSVAGSDITADSAPTLSVALGDVDGDGDLDLMAGNDGANRLYLNNGTSDPWNGVAGSDITADSAPTLSAALGDVDGDGDLDLMAGNDGANRLYLNNGTSDPWNGVAGSNITADVHDTRSVALGDLDGDGDLDLVAGNPSGPSRLYLNNGTPNPWTGVSGSNISSDVFWTLAMALGDVDGDGDLDLVVGNNSTPNRLYLNNGTSDPWNGVTGFDITSNSEQTLSVALGDVDGDGDLDLVEGNDGVNYLYLNDGAPNPFSSYSVISNDWDQSVSVVLGDVDGDGDLDLIVGNFSNYIRLYLNNGTSDPWNGVAGSNIGAFSFTTNSLALGDVDGDGDLDLVQGEYSGPSWLYLNNGTSDPWNGVSGSALPGGGNLAIVALGDVDGDGDLDLVEGNDGVNYLYLNNGTSDPWGGVSGTAITADAHTTTSVTLGDVDGDGDLDLVAGNDVTNRLYLNNGTSDPWNGVTGFDISADAHETHGVALGDVDGDGDLDLVAANSFYTSRLYLNNSMTDTSVPWSSGMDITAGAHLTLAVALGDVDGDGDLDLVEGNSGDPNLLYLNNGTSDPWNGVAGTEITADVYDTRSVALGDVDGDGDLDLVVGNSWEPNRLYLNNGTSDPWNGVAGSNITADVHDTRSVALGDVDGDGHLDLVAGNAGWPNRLYLNNGTSNPWNGAVGYEIGYGLDADNTVSVALGDLNGDGDLDLVAGNYGDPTRYYLNSGYGGGAVRFNSGIEITPTFELGTNSIALGDVDGDGDLDLVLGNTIPGGQANRLYLNNGTYYPWPGPTAGIEIGADAHETWAVALGDVDGDGDLDLVAGNDGANRLYLNNGTADPWTGVAGSDITADAHTTAAVTLGDVDGNGDLDLVAGNYSQPNRLYRQGVRYHTGHGRATSLKVDTETGCINNATLSLVGDLPANTAIDTYLSNNGGSRWLLARPGALLLFPGCGTDLRWRAGLRSLSPALSPRLDQIQITTTYIPSTIGDRVWEDLDGDGLQDAGEPGIVAALVYLYDGNGLLLDFTFTDSNGHYSLPRPWGDDEYSVRFIPPPGYALSPRDQGSDDSLDSDADPATGYTPVFSMKGIDNYLRWDAGMVPATACFPPDEPIYLYLVTLSTDGNNYPILNYQDPNQTTQITGYNVYRSSDSEPPPSTWQLIATDVIDMDEATPNKQWVDTSGDVSPSGIWYYSVTGYNHHCPAQSAEGPF